MKIVATEDNIFVHPLPAEQGGVYVPPVFQRKNQESLLGVVVAVGPEGRVEVGTQVVFFKYQDNGIEIDGQFLLIIKPMSLLAIK